MTTEQPRDLAWAVEQGQNATVVYGWGPNVRLIDADALRLLLQAAEDAERLEQRIAEAEAHWAHWDARAALWQATSDAHATVLEGVQRVLDCGVDVESGAEQVMARVARLERGLAFAMTERGRRMPDVLREHFPEVTPDDHALDCLDAARAAGAGEAERNVCSRCGRPRVKVGPGYWVCPDATCYELPGAALPTTPEPPR